MLKNIGLTSLQFIRRNLIAILSVLILSNLSQAATQWVVVAPGQTFLSGSPRGTVNVVTQVAGEQFSIDLYSARDDNWLFEAASTATFNLDWSGTQTYENFNPSSGSLTTTLPPATDVCFRGGILSTVIPTGNVSGPQTIQSTGSINSDSCIVPVQYIDHFAYDISGGNFIAGVPNVVTITAMDENDQVVENYHGTVQLQILDAGIDGSTLNIGNITFLSANHGQYFLSTTLYHASNLHALFRVIKSTNPALASSYSDPFTVLSATADRLILLGPNQRLESGSNTGNGRVVQSTLTSSQIAGGTFNVDVYACDPYWNTVTSSAVIHLAAAADPSFSTTNQSLSGGHVTFASLQLHTVGTGTVGLTASTVPAGLTNSIDTIPLTATTFDHFAIRGLYPSGGSYEAGATIPLTATAYDQYGNTTTSSIPVGTALQVWYSSHSTQMTGPGAFTPYSLSNATFDQTWFNAHGGIWNGTITIRGAYNNFTLEIIGGATTAVSNNFNVSTNTTNSLYKYLLILPGQTWVPGNYVGLIWGISGSPSNERAGYPFSVTVRATDRYGNPLTSYNESNISWNTLSPIGDKSDPRNPVTIGIANGVTCYAFTMTQMSNNQQRITLDGTISAQDGQSSIFTVYNGSVDHFTITPSATSVVAGTGFTASIHAEDVYYNLVTGYAGVVYITSPELDYSVPTESTIQVTNGWDSYTSQSTTACWRFTGFSGGIATANVTMYRATVASTATLYVSDLPTDSPSSNTGHVGQTEAITVAPRTAAVDWRFFAIIPGLTHRAGGIDASHIGAFIGNGYNGTSLSQQINTPFAVTAYATDMYYNLLSSTESFDIDCGSLPATFDGNIVDATHHYTTQLTNGMRFMTAICSSANSYNIRIAGKTGWTAYTSPSFDIFAVHHFGVLLPNGSDVPSTWVVGVPVTVSITAYVDDSGNVATTFNGTVELRSSLDWDTNWKCIETNPYPVTFSNGWWQGQVTIFRSNQDNSTYNTVEVYFGGVKKGNSSQFRIWQKPANRMLIIAPGMSWFQGIAPSIDPLGNHIIFGQPSIQTAGVTLTAVTFYLCDQYWNKVTETAQGALEPINISCSDNKSTLDGAPASSITKTFPGSSPGMYRATGSPTTGFTLYTVDGINNQWISVSKGALLPYTLNGSKIIKVKHADDLAAFTINAPTSDWTAGVMQYLTVAAVDAYGNTMDSINGGNPLPTYTQVNLSAGTGGGGNRAIWPYLIGNLETNKWTNGISNPDIYCYKKASGGGQFLSASYSLPSSEFASGRSANFTVNPNNYARLVAIVGTNVGSSSDMKFPDDAGAGGTYIGSYLSTPPPADITVFNNFGNPAVQRASFTPTYIRAYTCDIYGNMVNLTAPGVDIALTSTDRFAPNPATRTATGGFANFFDTGYQFHTVGTARVTMTDVTVNTMTAGVTPNITITPGDYYGMQLLAHGLIAVEGSGTINTIGVNPVPDHGWYSGVTPTVPNPLVPSVYAAYKQILGLPFSVTVQAVDMYGNFINNVEGETVRLTSSDTNGSSYPTGTNYRDVVLSGGRAIQECKFFTKTSTNIMLENRTHPAIIGSMHSLATVEVISEDETSFVVFVNGISRDDSLDALVDAYPNTFNVRVEVQYYASKSIVGSNIDFEIDATYNLGSNVVPNYEQNLLVTNGRTNDGIKLITNEAYRRQENIYLRVKPVGGALYPATGYSPLIRVQASRPHHIEMTSGATYISSSGYYQIQANNTTPIYAQVFDENNNPVVGKPVNLSIVNQSDTSSVIGDPSSNSVNATDVNGLMNRTFIAGAKNLLHPIQAECEGALGQLLMKVTVTNNGGVYPNPFNPLRGEKVSVDYSLESDSNVKILVYTLMGSLVYTKDYSKGSEGGHQGLNSVMWDGKNDNGVTVANGGYICVIKANDQELKPRFKIGVYKER